MNHRTVAALAAAGGAAHLLMLLPHPGFSPHSVLFTAMSLACLTCAAHLWRSNEGLGLAALMAAAMIVLHLGHLFAVTAPFEATVTHHTVIPVGGHTHGDSLAVLVPLIPEFAVLALTGPLLRRRTELN
ncbi:hypothetical protein LWF15_24860 [Kineosporia rhizophila]|uniref:hypothetical protein n=1 Tax=Kineosporia TaxID=49184 RepID=UPI000AC7457A|nr:MULTISPECIES: hypothetical protein [Kineosporia]MCE0538734.1 hypothetical protein [Kineosporia rhizophila]GLY19511.1 hypothetical protein Kisp01_65250 [Kineosporia sp. NBRC 101677]